jgi:hypothetical protein
LKNLLVRSTVLKVEIENGGVTQNFESGPPKDHFNKISEQKNLM